MHRVLLLTTVSIVPPHASHSTMGLEHRHCFRDRDQQNQDTQGGMHRRPIH